MKKNSTFAGFISDIINSANGFTGSNLIRNEAAIIAVCESFRNKGKAEKYYHSHFYFVGEDTDEIDVLAADLMEKYPDVFKRAQLILEMRKAHE